LRYEVRGFGVHVVLIEPGPIRTSFTGTANESMPDATADAAYADYHAAVAKADAEADQSRLLAGDPEDAAAVIERAIGARRPPAPTTSPSSPSTSRRGSDRRTGTTSSRSTATWSTPTPPSRTPRSVGTSRTPPSASSPGRWPRPSPRSPA